MVSVKGLCNIVLDFIDFSRAMYKSRNISRPFADMFI